MSREEQQTRREILGRLGARMAQQPIDSGNEFMVGVRGDGKVVITRFGLSLTPEGALNLAAWLSVLADPGGERFERLVQEIKNT